MKLHSTGTTNTGNPRQPSGLLRDCTVHDAAPICTIYNHYVAQTRVTFEETAVLVGEMAQRMAEATAQFPWLVWERDGTVLGYAEKLGFIKAGHLHEIGFKFGQWIDVGYWELRLP